MSAFPSRKIGRYCVPGSWDSDRPDLRTTSDDRSSELCGTRVVYVYAFWLFGGRLQQVKDNADPDSRIGKVEREHNMLALSFAPFDESLASTHGPDSLQAIVALLEMIHVVVTTSCHRVVASPIRQKLNVGEGCPGRLGRVLDFSLLGRPC